jgi:hypothetical protein
MDRSISDASDCSGVQMSKANYNRLVIGIGLLIAFHVENVGMSVCQRYGLMCHQQTMGKDHRQYTAIDGIRYP